MKKSELKKLLKPLVKECIKESLMEDGLLSSIISEVASGLVSSPLIRESQAPQTRPSEYDARMEANLQEKREELERDRQERIRVLNESTSKKFGGVNIFEGTTPVPADRQTSATPGALSGVDPRDPGVNIDGIAALAGGRWNKILKGK